jgi:hypothetical protein
VLSRGDGHAKLPPPTTPPSPRGMWNAQGQQVPPHTHTHTHKNKIIQLTVKFAQTPPHLAHLLVSSCPKLGQEHPPHTHTTTTHTHHPRPYPPDCCPRQAPGGCPGAQRSRRRRPGQSWAPPRSRSPQSGSPGARTWASRSPRCLASRSLRGQGSRQCGWPWQPPWRWAERVGGARADGCPAAASEGSQQGSGGGQWAGNLKRSWCIFACTISQQAGAG